MNKNLGITLIIYGFGIGGLGYAVHQMASEVARPTLLAGLAGGILSLWWGIQWSRGRGRKVWPILTLIPVCYVLLGQTVTAWMGEAERIVAGSITLALAASFGMLVRVAYHGVFGQTPSHRLEERHPGAKAESTGGQETKSYTR